MKPNNFAEYVVWYSLIYMYAFYFIGGVYVVGSFLGWILLFYFFKKINNKSSTKTPKKNISIPWVIWVWIIAMFIEEIALIMGHLDFNLGAGMVIKSSIGWAKGWALMALFPLIGSCLEIRPQLLYRAVCIVCFQTILLTPFLFAAGMVHLPSPLYVSPLKAVGGGDIFFEVSLYTSDPAGMRWQFFAPWAPATGMIGNVYFFIALQEKDKKWRWLGILGSCILCYMSKSRMALLCIPFVWILTWGLTKLTRPIHLIFMGFGSTLTGIAAPLILDAVTTFKNNFNSVRPDSSRVRNALQKIAIQRWESEAPIWGHGTVEEGPHLVENMPIGSHHTIFSLLFIKGIVGLVAFIISMVCSFLDLLIKAQTSETAKLGLSMLLIFAFYTAGENLEVLAYLFWPGLVIMGMAFKEQLKIS